MGQKLTAAITGRSDRTCQGDSVAADLVMTGRGPWTLVINDSDGEYLTLKEIDSPYLIWLKPVQDNNYYIASVVDSKGIAGLTFGNVGISVLPLTPVEIVLYRTSFIQFEPGVTLNSNPAGAAFFGNGVSGNIFYPAVATPVGSPHEITCTYTNLYGCKSQDQVDIAVIYGKSEVVLTSGTDTINTVCDDQILYEIRGSNLDNLPGLFSLRQMSSSFDIEGNIVDEDSSDNFAFFSSSGLSGTYDLIYTYSFDVLTVTATQRIHVNNLASVTIDGFPDIICSEDEPYLLTPGNIPDDSEAVYIINGPGVSGSQAAGFYFDPAAPFGQLDSVQIVMDYTTSEGCSTSIERVVQILVSPNPSFTFSTTCLPTEGGTISFENTTSSKISVDKWEWDFGDPESGSHNRSNVENPDHFYVAPGLKQVSLKAHTAYGCVSTSVQDVLLLGNPEAGLTWFHDCFLGGQETSFMDRSETGFSSIDSLVWTFKTEDGEILETRMSHSPGDTIRFQFSTLDSYQVQLEVWNQEGCNDRINQEIKLQPTQVIRSGSYSDHFDSGASGWTIGTEGQVSSWTLGMPDFTGFDPVPGDQAWYTSLPSDEDYLERSWVESPCFDLTQIEKPRIEIDLMKSFRPGLDGAVLQYHEGNGDGWVTLGSVGDGNNWYNLSEIEYLPGGSLFGWGLNQYPPDSGWVRARYEIKELVGKPHIKFRIVIVTGSLTGSGNQGFAFDNFSISESLRGSIIEHFTNSSQAGSRIADDIIDDLVLRNASQVIDLQYHVDYPGEDPMNENNIFPPSTRSFQLGIPSVPYAVLNGRDEQVFRFDFSGLAEIPNDEILYQVSLESAPFNMELDVDWNEGSMEAMVTTVCTTDSFPSNVQLYVVVVERFVTAYKGANQDEEFRNVVLDMLPTPAGKLLGNEWEKGQSVPVNYRWDYPNYVEDIEDLMVVAFVQDRDNGGIMQAVAESLTPQVGILKPIRQAAGLVVYPNPAHDNLFVKLGTSPDREGRLRITDLSGRVMLETDVQPGYSLQMLEISHLSQGMYMISWLESGVLKGSAKMVRAR
jgi:PKD repeat protein